jgi:surface protein
MTIASELTTLNSTKQAIKTAIEAKGQDLTGVAFSGYPAKIDAISGGGSSGGPLEWSQAYYDAKLAAAWVRDPLWLTLPTLATKGMVGLRSVNDTTNEVVALKGVGGAYTVDWGDGVVEDFANGVAAYHVYTFSSLSAGTVLADGSRQAIVKVYPQAGQSFTSIDLSIKHTRHSGVVNENGWLDIDLATHASTTMPILTSNLSSTTLIYMNQLERFVWTSDGFTGTSLAYMFSNMRNLASVSLPTLATVKNMAYMFAYCNSLQTIPLLNTAAVTNMQYMFSRCYSLQTMPLLNTSAVTDMTNMFAYCTSLQTIPLLNTTAVTNMTSMFTDCYSLQTIPLLNTAAVTNMTTMFLNCYSLQTIPLLNTVKVTNMNGMVQNCYSLQTIPLLNTVTVFNMGGMFANCYSLQTIPLLNTENVTNMASMFSGCSALQTIPPLTIHTVAFVNMSNMFQFCSSLRTIPLLNTVKVTNMASMFSGCTALQTIPQLNTAAVISVANLSNMFASCPSLSRIKAKGFKHSFSVSSCLLSAAAISELCYGLGLNSGQTLTITSNFGASPIVSLSGTTTAGSNIITMANTTGIVVGMQVTGSNTPSTAEVACTFTDVGDLVTVTAHGLANGTEVAFSSISTTSGIVTNTIYYVINATTDTFQLSDTLGGAARTLTNNGTGWMKYGAVVTAITPNVSVTMSTKMSRTGTGTLSFREAMTHRALMQGWSVTG